MNNSDVSKPTSEAYRPLTTNQTAWAAVDSPWQSWQKNGRWLAALTQVKDTVNIILMLCDGTLLFGILFGFGIPGLIFYALRWRQVRQRVGRGSMMVLAILSLAHEVIWACIFQADTTAQKPIEHASGLAILYWLGAGLNALLLLTAMLAPAQDSESTLMSADRNQMADE